MTMKASDLVLFFSLFLSDFFDPTHGHFIFQALAILCLIYKLTQGRWTHFLNWLLDRHKALTPPWHATVSTHSRALAFSSNTWTIQYNWHTLSILMGFSTEQHMFLTQKILPECCLALACKVLQPCFNIDRLLPRRPNSFVHKWYGCLQMLDFQCCLASYWQLPLSGLVGSFVCCQATHL